MSDTNSPSIVRGDQVTFGHPHIYRNGAPTGTWVHVDGETFIDYNGTLYTVCGYCDTNRPGVKAHYGHVLDGECFQCRGQGIRKAIGDVAAATKVARRRIRARERAAEKRNAAYEAQIVARDAWTAQYPDLAARLAAIREDLAVDGDEHDPAAWVSHDETARVYGSFVVDLANKAGFNALSEKQTLAVIKAIEEGDLAKAETDAVRAQARYLGTVGEKGVTMRGTVVVRTQVEDYYSYNGGSKALVIIEGSGEFVGVTVKMCGTAACLYPLGRGDEVEVTGTIKDHSDYQGTPQTVLIRPKVTVLVAAKSEED